MAKLAKKLSFGEELANSISHGVGAVLMLVLLPFSAIYSYTHFNLQHTIGISIFMISLFLMFLASTIYHAMTYDSQQKYVTRVIDHSMIFIAIAGSYTPVALFLIQGWLGYLILIIEWSLTLFGILYKAISQNMSKRFSLAIYISMGWLVIFIIPFLLQSASLTFLLLMLIGGLLYTIGAIFYARKKPYAHFIWHLFILAASLSQYIAIVFFM